MNKLFLSAVSSLAIVGVAIAADSTQFGVFFVPSVATNTIVAVPWLKSGTGSDPVRVADLVLTAGLEAAHDGYLGDELKYYSGNNTYLVWRLLADSQGVKYWSGGNMVNDNVVSDVPNAQDQSVVRGQAIILKRANPENGFYIMGKPADATAADMTLPAGAYSLIAPPNLTDTDVNTGLTWVGVGEVNKDYLYIPSPNAGEAMDIYKYSPTDPAGWKNTKTGVKGGVIKAGVGAWFYTKGTSARSVKWSAPAN